MTPLTELTLFTAATFFGCIHSLVCLPWKNDSKNIGSVLLCSWLFVGCFMLFVNSLTMNAIIWCDICEWFCNTTGQSQGADYHYDGSATKLMIGAYIGVPASIVCVLHHLYTIVSAPDSLPNKVRTENSIINPILTCYVPAVPSAPLQTRSYAGHACTGHCYP